MTKTSQDSKQRILLAVTERLHAAKTASVFDSNFNSNLIPIPLIRLRTDLQWILFYQVAWKGSTVYVYPTMTYQWFSPGLSAETKDPPFHWALRIITTCSYHKLNTNLTKILFFVCDWIGLWQNPSLLAALKFKSGLTNMRDMVSCRLQSTDVWYSGQERLPKAVNVNVICYSTPCPCFTPFFHALLSYPGIVYI